MGVGLRKADAFKVDCPSHVAVGLRGKSLHLEASLGLHLCASTYQRWELGR